MAYTKKFKKGLKSLPKKAYKKVYGSRTIPQALSSTGKVARDVLALTKTVGMLASRLNVEKKLVDRDVATTGVGQVNVNAEGSIALDVTPIISQGVGEANRVGNSLKLTGLSFPMSFTQEGSCLGDRLLRVSLYKVTSSDNGVTPQECYNQLYDVNPLTGIKDFNAPKAYRNAKTDGIKHIRTQMVMVKSTNSGNSDSAIGITERQVRNIRFNVKLQDLLRYNSNSDTLPTGTRYFLIIQCNAGNVGATASTRDVAVTSPATGITARIAQRSWYVDN